ncbi:MAG: outer membrane beta-barrel protein, partial [Bacteroidales bacterium]|nr:outer membrane beta-barrel protein [Bacteroidales bacterium]
MNLPQSWVIQFSAQYFAPRTTIQGNQAYFFYSDIAVKKSLNKRATISLRISDLMRTARRKGKTVADDYTSFNFGRPYRNSIMLNFSYRFGDSMPKPPQKRAKRLDDGSGSENAGAEAEE